MKRTLFCTALMALMSQSVMAQDVYDVARLSTSDLNGTARFIGMGGALSALGGDVTTAATNPAGIGIFRSNDVSVSGGSVMLGNKDMVKNNRASFDQMGVVFSSKYSNYSPLRYLNYGVNYRKRTNFFDSYGVGNVWNGDFSQTYSMAEMTYDMLDGRQMPMLAAMAVNSGALYVDKDNHYTGIPAADSYFNTIQKGGISEIDFTLAANYNDQVFLGATVGYYDVNLTRSSYYTENNNDDGGYYDLYNDYFTDGAGVDLKLGAIIRPIADSGFRFGVSIHTPTFYTLTDSNSAYMYVYENNGKEIGSSGKYTDPMDYQLRTPWKFNLSLGHTIGNKLALGAEYELEDYSTIRIRTGEGLQSNYTDYVDNSCRDFLKTVHTLRLGLEYKPVADLSLRAGYNLQTAQYNIGAYRSLVDFTDMNVDTFTDTQYENLFSLNRFTAGIGYRIDQFYMDLGYQFSTQKSDFFAFDDYYTDNGTTVYLPATELKKNRHQVTLTLGYKF